MVIKGCGEFTEHLLGSVGDIYNRIISHPFNKKLSDGTLSGKSFREYLEQDILYLKEDTLAISITEQNAPPGDEKSFFYRLVTAGIDLEKALHKELSDSFGMHNNAVMNFACRNYSRFLVDTASGKTYAEAASALLPCYWIYQNAGLSAAENSVPDNPYQAWLDAYSGEVFTAYTLEYIQIVEKIAERSDKRTIGEMEYAFKTAVSHEFAFINSISL